MWNPFVKRKDIQVLQKKSNIFPNGWLINGGGYSNNLLTIRRALKFYDNAAPVATAVDWINDEFKTVNLVLETNNVIDPKNEVLTFLKQPNDDMTREEFLEALGAYYLITNEVYIIATGAINRPPAELLIVSPEYITIFKGQDGFINQINVNYIGTGAEIFRRADDSYRFYNVKQNAEIWQIKGFSALGDGLSGANDLVGNGILSSRGRSKLSSIHREINQYIEIAQHNLATLDNGLLPSGTIEMPEGVTLDEDQFEQVREQIVNYYSGAKNAGKVLILPNGLKFVPQGVFPKDMDFKELTRQVTMTIFNRYKVPLPLISPDNMTLANMDTAKFNLYDNCVIPLAGRLLREITNFLRPRFNLGENTLIIADLSKVPALRLRHLEQLKLKKDLGIYSTNELREMDGAEPDPKGNDILVPWTLVPIGTMPAQQTSNSNDPNRPTLKEFTSIMQAQLDVKGIRIYSDKDIEMFAISQGI